MSNQKFNLDDLSRADLINLIGELRQEVDDVRAMREQFFIGPMLEWCAKHPDVNVSGPHDPEQLGVDHEFGMKQILTLAGQTREAFVSGAKWWEFTKTGATMWGDDQNKAREEALRRYPHAPTPMEEAHLRENQELREKHE